MDQPTQKSHPEQASLYPKIAEAFPELEMITCEPALVRLQCRKCGRKCYYAQHNESWHEPPNPVIFTQLAISGIRRLLRDGPCSKGHIVYKICCARSSNRSVCDKCGRDLT